MKSKKMRPQVSGVLKTLLVRISFAVCLLVCICLTSCQSRPYPYGYPQYQMQRQFAPAPRTTMSIRAVKSDSAQNVSKAKSKSSRPPKFQSTYVDPPLPKNGYHARLDTTKYQSMGYVPFYRVLSPTRRWNMPEKAFWEWYTPAQKRGWNYIKIFDPYSRTAPPSKR